MNTATLTKQSYVTHNTTDSTIDLHGVVEQGVIDNCPAKQIHAMFGAPIKDSEGNDFWAVRFDDGTVAGIRRRTKDSGWSVAGKLTDKTNRAAMMMKITVDLYAEAEQEKAESKGKSTDPYAKLEQGLQSAKEMMDSIVVGKGRTYACLIELIMIVRKMSALNEHLINMVVDAEILPKIMKMPMKNMDEEMSVKIIALAAQIGGVVECEAEAKEAMDWASRIMEAERSAVTGMVETVLKNKDGK